MIIWGHFLADHACLTGKVLDDFNLEIQAQKEGSPRLFLINCVTNRGIYVYVEMSGTMNYFRLQKVGSATKK